MKVLFLVPYPLNSAGSQRFRFEQYFWVLKNEGIDYEVQSFLDKAAWSILYKQGFFRAKIFGLIKGFLRRILILFTVGKYDLIFIHRETAPIGPPIFEWLITRIWKKKIIYDFDDAIWKANTSFENSLVTKFKWHRKAKAICRWSWKVSAGNRFLADYASPFNANVAVNPTTIDAKILHIPKSMSENRLTIGWTGTHSTLKYLEPLILPLNELSLHYDFDFLVIADKNPNLPIKNFIFKNWSIETETDDLNQIDIGLMPLQDDEWARGKCGFKALQFMALEIPVLVSPVGVNTFIVEHGVHGFHCKANRDWIRYLEKLMTDSTLRSTMGIAGRQKVVDQFSTESNKDNFLSLFDLVPSQV